MCSKAISIRKGHTEPEGPYGEYVGYYGVVKRNPMFHLTAVTHRKDALFQTATIGGRHLARTDTAQLTTVKTESAAWAALQTAVREPVAVYATPSSGGMYNLRVSLRQRVPGEARNAIAAVFGSSADAKHVFVFDDDIDVFSDEQVDWALATRFQADRDLIVASGFRAVPLDPSLGGARTGAKVGFDCTIPFGKTERARMERADAAAAAGARAAEVGRGRACRGAGELRRADGGARQPRRPRGRARAGWPLCGRPARSPRGRALYVEGSNVSFAVVVVSHAVVTLPLAGRVARRSQAQRRRRRAGWASSREMFASTPRHISTTPLSSPPPQGGREQAVHATSAQITSATHHSSSRVPQ